ncbi:hypothetical protein MLOOGBEN_00600 [Bacillus sp. EB106-08-02-XG196]|nr:hypothetical protein [Bacillus sp. EB106-08-02-XG196]
MDFLRSTNMSMIDLAYASGFQTLSTFNKQFKTYSVRPPQGYRQME